MFCFLRLCYILRLCDTNISLYASLRTFPLIKRSICEPQSRVIINFLIFWQFFFFFIHRLRHHKLWALKQMLETTVQSSRERARKRTSKSHPATICVCFMQRQIIILFELYLNLSGAGLTAKGTRKNSDKVKCYVALTIVVSIRSLYYAMYPMKFIFCFRFIAFENKLLS